MNRQVFTVVGIGELLWDLLPGGKQLGGAPANFVYHVTSLGDKGIIVSRIGDDDLGKETTSRLRELGMVSSHIQIDPQYSTGTVKVEVDERGEPDFTIIEDIAWDFVEWNQTLEKLALAADAVCFGSLAQRAMRTRGTIRTFLRLIHNQCLTVFDVNLRQSFFSPEILAESLVLSKIVKLNDEELPRVSRLLGLSGDSDVAMARALVNRYHLELVCVTKGALGSLLVAPGNIHTHPGFKVDVTDTVGSGDAFTAALVYYYLRRRNIEEINSAANKLGSLVAQYSGGTPETEPHFYEELP